MTSPEFKPEQEGNQNKRDEENQLDASLLNAFARDVLEGRPARKALSPEQRRALHKRVLDLLNKNEELCNSILSK